MVGVGKIVAFCKRNGMAYTVQELKHGYKRVKLEFSGYEDFRLAMLAFSRLRGVYCDTWTAHGGGVWEGNIYLYSTADKIELDELQQAETQRNNNWWIAFRAAISSGLDRQQAAEKAERLFPAPA